MTEGGGGREEEVDVVQLRSTMCRIKGVAKVDDVVVCEADMAAVVRDR